MDADDKSSAMAPSRESSIDHESIALEKQNSVILELRAERQNMKNYVQNVETIQLSAQVQALLLQCQHQEAIAKQELGRRTCWKERKAD